MSARRPGSWSSSSGRPVLVEHLEGAGELVRLGGEQRRAVRAADLLAQEPHRRVVDVDQAPPGVLHGHGVGDAGEDRLELVAGERVGAAPRGELGDVLEGEDRDRRAPGRHDDGARGHERAHALRRRPLDLDVLDPVTRRDAGVLGAVELERERSPGHPVRRAVGEEDAPAVDADQQQRRRQQVEERLVPAAARCRLRLRCGDRESLFRLPGERARSSPLGERLFACQATLRLTPAPLPRTRAGSPRRAGGGPPRRGGSR